MGAEGGPMAYFYNHLVVVAEVVECKRKTIVNASRAKLDEVCTWLCQRLNWTGKYARNADQYINLNVWSN